MAVSMSKERILRSLIMPRSMLRAISLSVVKGKKEGSEKQWLFLRESLSCSLFLLGGHAANLPQLLPCHRAVDRA